MASDVNNIFNAYKHVQSYLHSEIHCTFENNQEITYKLSVCRLPISFVQATWSFVVLHRSWNNSTTKYTYLYFSNAAFVPKVQRRWELKNDDTISRRR